MNQIYLCKPDGEILGVLNGIDDNNVILTKSITAPFELSFTVDKYVMYRGNKIVSNFYDSVSEHMELLLVTDKEKIKFIIDSEPSVAVSKVQEVKQVIAHSVEAELQYKLLRNFVINAGTPESQENLIKGDINGNIVKQGELNKELYDYNINPYTQLPIDYITVSSYRQNYEELSNAIKQTASNMLHIDWRDYHLDVSTENGVLSPVLNNIDTETVVRLFTELVKTFPKLQYNIRYGIDNVYAKINGQRVKSVTWGKIICFSEAILSLNNQQTENPLPTIIQPLYQAVSVDSEGVTTYTNFVVPKDTQIDYANIFITHYKAVIEYYSKYESQLNLLDLALEKAKVSGWTIGEIPEHIATSVYNFEIGSQDIYSFFTQTCANTMKVMFDFDRFERKINIIDISNEDEKHDTGVFIGLRNLANTININTTSEDGIITKIRPNGADDLGVGYVNFGEDDIVNLDYFMNKVNDINEKQFVSQSLADKYYNWKRKRDKEEISITIPQTAVKPYSKELIKSTVTVKGTRRKLYSVISQAYNKTIKDIDEIKNLVPIDGTKVDYNSYSQEALEKSYTAYQNAFQALIECYKTDYNIKDFDIETLDTITNSGNQGINIKDTLYWYDFICYRDSILPNIESAMKKFFATKNGEFIRNEDGSLKQILGGNPEYLNDPKIASGNYAYKYDVSIYGRDELETLKKSYIEKASALYKSAYIKRGEPLADLNGGTVEYNSTDSWASLTKEQQADFLGEDDFKEKIAIYLDYVSSYKRVNKTVSEGKYGVGTSLTVTCEGIIWQFNEAIKTCDATIHELEETQRSLSTLRNNIATDCSMENESNFTAEELSVLYKLISEADYSNENIMVTKNENGFRVSDNDLSYVVDAQEELYQDAMKRLYEVSKPQYSFTVSLDNLFAIKEFEPIRDSVALFNYIQLVIGLDTTETVKLRIVEMTYNPIVDSEDLTLKFSNMRYTCNGFSDLSNLFSDSLSMSNNISGHSNSSSNGYGSNDTQITLSNNLINALLKNRDFSIYDGAQSLINANNLLTLDNANKVYPTYSMLKDKNGKVYIDCSNLKSGVIKSVAEFQDTNDNNKIKPVSEIDLDSGNISLGKGHLSWNNATGKLIVSGEIQSTSGKIGGFTIDNNSLNANNNSIGISTGEYMLWAGNATSSKAPFRVTKAGKLVATNAEITGKIIANSGNIGGLEIDENGISIHDDADNGGDFYIPEYMPDEYGYLFQLKSSFDDVDSDKRLILRTIHDGLRVTREGTVIIKDLIVENGIQIKDATHSGYAYLSYRENNSSSDFDIELNVPQNNGAWATKKGSSLQITK